MFLELDQDTNQVVQFLTINPFVLCPEILHYKYREVADEEYNRVREFHQYGLFDFIDGKLKVHQHAINIHAKNIRVFKERMTEVTFKNEPIEFSDKTALYISGYLSSGITNIEWKCLNGRFIYLNREEMQLLLTEILRLKAILFSDEAAYVTSCEINKGVTQ